MAKLLSVISQSRQDQLVLSSVGLRNILVDPADVFSPLPSPPLGLSFDPVEGEGAAGLAFCAVAACELSSWAPSAEPFDQLAACLDEI